MSKKKPDLFISKEIFLTVMKMHSLTHVADFMLSTLKTLFSEATTPLPPPTGLNTFLLKVEAFAWNFPSQVRVNKVQK